MPDQKSLPSRQILLAADREELVERIELLQAELQRRMDVEEELLHVNLQKGTASLQTQVEEASRRFKVAQQELEAFRLEILQAEGDPAAQTPRPYIYEDLSAPPQEGPDRSQLRSLLQTFRRLRDERDRLRQEVEQSKVEVVELRDAAQREKVRAEKGAAEIATLGVTVADLDIARGRLLQEVEAARADVERLKAEADRPVCSPPPVAPPEPETRAPAPASGEVASLKEHLAEVQA